MQTPPTLRFSPRLLFPAVALVLALFSGEGRARASGGPTDQSTGAQGLAGLIGAPAVTLGLVTDTGIALHRWTGDGRVPRSWAITGTVAWSIGTICSTVIVATVQSEYGGPTYYQQNAAPIFAAAYGVLAANLASLAFSIYGLTRPPLPSLAARAAGWHGITFASPVFAGGPSGARVVLGGTF